MHIRLTIRTVSGLADNITAVSRTTRDVIPQKTGLGNISMTTGPISIPPAITQPGAAHTSIR